MWGGEGVRENRVIGDFGEARARDTRSFPLVLSLPLEIAPETLIPFNQTPAGPVTVSLCLLFVAGKIKGETVFMQAFV